MDNGTAKRKRYWPSGSGRKRSPDSDNKSANVSDDILSPKVNEYYVWNYYLFDRNYRQEVEKVKQCELFIVQKHFTDEQLQSIEVKCWFTVDFNEIRGFNSSLAESIENEPDATCRCIALAMHQHMIVRAIADGFTEDTYTIGTLKARLTNFTNFVGIKSLNPSLFDKLVAVKGTVVKTGGVKDICTRLVFRCVACGKDFPVNQPGGKYRPLKQCKDNGCRCSRLTLMKDHRLTEYSTLQMVKIQEICESAYESNGRLPTTINVEISDEMVNKCIIGDVINVTGIVKILEPTTQSKASNRNAKSSFECYVSAVDVVSNKKFSESLEVFSDEEVQQFQDIANNDNPFRLLVASLNPSIYGYELIKAGILFALFGATQRYADKSKQIPLRCNPHVLIVGDPGLGKSQLLKSAANVAPISSYVCGNTSTSVGLTVALNREKSTNDYSIEGGALVLADGGLCCIDEFDKMGSQHQSLLEAMERQTVSIAKAGFVCSISARSSVLAAANPVRGRYNRSKSVSENLKMSSAILSRFDLIFVLIDKPNIKIDLHLSSHIMAMKSKRCIASGVHSVSNTSFSDKITEERYEMHSQPGEKRNLEDRLRYRIDELPNLIPHVLLKKYIAYARKFIHPTLNEPATKAIGKFYLKLRNQSQSFNTPLVTIRQLESLIRLTESRARLELREIATEEDAEDVIAVFDQSMKDTYMDEAGNVFLDRSVLGVGMSGRSQAKRFIAHLMKVRNETGNKVFSKEQLKEMGKECNINVPDFDDFIDGLNTQSYIMKLADKNYKLV